MQAECDILRLSFCKLAHTCVEATVRFAAELGYDVTMVRDATTDYSDEAMHAALDVNIPNYANAIVTTAEICRYGRAKCTVVTIARIVGSHPIVRPMVHCRTRAESQNKNVGESHRHSTWPKADPDAAR